jgi:hypothetical protein
MGWKEIRNLLDRGHQEGARYAAASWALDTLRAQLGEDWLARAVELRDGDFPLALHLLSSHAQALAEALEWALRLDMCHDWDGSADFLRDLLNDPRPSRILHSRAQLAQAAFAEYLGWPVVLEPGGDGGGPPADLAFDAPSGSLVTEIKVLMQSDIARRQHEIAQDTTDWLFWLGLEHNVWIGGELGREPDDAEKLEIERLVRDASAKMGLRDRARFSRPEISLEVSERGSGAPGLTSPPVREELLGRMVRAIATKTEKMGRSGAGWLHVTALTGLWPFTSWGRDQLDGKLERMSSVLTASLQDHCPAGIVLTSAASLAPEGTPEEVVRSEAGIALRTGVPPLRARETLILPFSEASRRGGEDWLALARVESGWLNRALAQKGLPDLQRVFNLKAS